jgi:poly(glycerol-phosphate) alpha-glucosyltransferase
MKVALLSSSLSKKGGGVAEVVLRLGQNLIKLPGMEVEAFGLQDGEIQNDLALWQPIKTTICPVFGPAFFGYSPGLVPALKKSGAQLVHLHGLWQYPSLACRISKLPYVTTIHGMLEQWAIKNSGLKKQIAAAFYENASLKKAKCLQAFTLQEYNDIRKYGLKNPVCVIPNGVDLPENINDLKKQDAPWKNIISPGQNVLLYLGRIHPKKGLTNLITAWKQAVVGSSNKNWNLVIAGWDQGGYEQQLKTLVGKLEIKDSVHFIGPQFEMNKKLVFAHANGFILPSFSEGLPMAVLEAWAYQLPVLMTKQCNLPEGFKLNAAIEIAPNIESITQGLIHLFSKDKENLIEIGMAGKILVTQKFTWHHVSDQMHKVYEWVIGKSAMPQNVIVE